MPAYEQFDLSPTSLIEERRFPIESIRRRKSLTSRLNWANEFVVVLRDGSSGTAISPQGETLGCYEANDGAADEWPGGRDGRAILHSLRQADGQHQFDGSLREHRYRIGQRNSYALSLAYFNAICASTLLSGADMIRRLYDIDDAGNAPFPALLFNTLNGGLHAYTNPVLSDFSEYLLVPGMRDVNEQLECFRGIAPLVRERLAPLPRERVGENWVHSTAVRDNRVWLDLLLDVLEQLGLSDRFDLMIDASAGLLRRQGQYALPVTGRGASTPEEFVQYWAALLKEYPIKILEDPFSEDDLESWRALSSAFPDRALAGDDLCAGDPGRIADAARRGCMSMAIIKPSQAGTVSDAVAAFQASLENDIGPIPSHRSIDTADEFLSDLCHVFGVSRAKLGLLSDFDTVCRLNALIRRFET